MVLLVGRPRVGGVVVLGGVVPGFGPQRMSSAALYLVVNCSAFCRTPFFAK